MSWIELGQRRINLSKVRSIERREKNQIVFVFDEAPHLVVQVTDHDQEASLFDDFDEEFVELKELWGIRDSRWTTDI